MKFNGAAAMKSVRRSPLTLTGSGFTLIELMIVIAIIGILASIAWMVYKDQLVRSRVVEGLVLASPVKAAVAEYWYNSNGEFISVEPCTTANIQCTQTYGVTPPQGGNFSINVLAGWGGTIIVTYNHLVDPGAPGYTLVLQPKPTENGKLEWVCFSAGSGATKNGVTTNAMASMPAKYAPPECR